MLCSIQAGLRIIIIVIEILILIAVAPLLFFMTISYLGFHGPRGIFTYLRNSQNFNILRY
jgi:hypothetical protein